MSGLFSIVGAPSPKLYAVLNIVRALVRVTIGEPLVVVANSLEALRENFPDRPTRNNRPVVLLSDYPQPDLLAALAALNAPMVISIDDLTNVALFSVVSRGFGGADAARFATMGLVNVEPTVVSPPPVSLFVGDPKVETLAGLIARLAAFYKPPMKEGAEAEVLALVGFAGRRGASLGAYIDGKVPAVDQVAQDARASLESRSPLESELIDFLAPQYDAIVHGRPLESLEWPVYALLRPEFPDRLTIAPIDLTGPARFIHFGPYFALPAGAWGADVSLDAGLLLRQPDRGRRVRGGQAPGGRACETAGPWRLWLQDRVRDRRPVETGRNSHAVAVRGDRMRHTLARHRAPPAELARRGGRGGGLGRG